MTKMEDFFKKVKFCTQKLSDFIDHKYGHIFSQEKMSLMVSCLSLVIFIF